MVAIVNPTKSIHRAFYYNENKVAKEHAVNIAAFNYPKDLGELTIAQKLAFLENQAARHPSTQYKGIHISLNFPPEEHHDDARLNQIAQSFMDKIGFGQQPFLVYIHTDAAHPHIHIVSTTIRSDGSRIDTHNIGRDRAMQARKEVEQEFNLIPAQGRKQGANQLKPTPIDIHKINDGRQPLGTSIANVVQHIFSSYSFTSLGELNSILGQWNVIADRGASGSKMFQRGGLVYMGKDAEGNRTSSIPASNLYNTPTLKKIKNRFLIHARGRRKLAEKLIFQLRLSLLHPPQNMEDWTLTLHAKGIDVVIHRGKNNIPFGITYIDHKNLAAFNGSSLGKEFSMKAILKSFGQHLQPSHGAAALPLQLGPMLPKSEGTFDQLHTTAEEHHLATPGTFDAGDFFEILFQEDHSTDYVPFPLRAKRKKKKWTRDSK